jgi:hypothetical protein
MSAPEIRDRIRNWKQTGGRKGVKARVILLSTINCILEELARM